MFGVQLSSKPCRKLSLCRISLYNPVGFGRVWVLSRYSNHGLLSLA
uniref:Uncharacterized protein n=1 Tax=Populus trichocarpa TaxID=3694 RepID=A0A3N7FB76_POPTR